MSGRIALIAVVTLVGVQVAATAAAEDEFVPQPAHRPTLSERLQRFRNDLLGNSDDNRPRRQPSQPPQGMVAPPASRKITGRSRPVMIAPSVPPPQGAQIEMIPHDASRQPSSVRDAAEDADAVGPPGTRRLRSGHSATDARARP